MKRLYEGVLIALPLVPHHGNLAQPRMSLQARASIPLRDRDYLYSTASHARDYIDQLARRNVYGYVHAYSAKLNRWRYEYCQTELTD